LGACPQVFSEAKRLRATPSLLTIIISKGTGKKQRMNRLDELNAGEKPGRPYPEAR
jgi:hypothetical protein